MIEIKIFKKDEIKKEFDLCVKAYDLAGFTDEEYIRTMIEDSLAVGLAYYGGELAGVGRIVGDRAEVSFIVNLSYPRQELPVLSLKTHRDELPRHPISTDLVV